MRFSECRKRPVLDTSTAQHVGRVDRFVVDAASRRIHAVLIGKHKHGSVLRWGDVQGFGPDAVTVASAASISEPRDALDGAGDLIGERVVTDRGFELGRVKDVEFDPTTGELQLVLLEGQAIEGADLLGAGRYAVVVRHPREEPTTPPHP